MGLREGQYVRETCTNSLVTNIYIYIFIYMFMLKSKDKHRINKFGYVYFFLSSTSFFFIYYYWYCNFVSIFTVSNTLYEPNKAWTRKINCNRSLHTTAGENRNILKEHCHSARFDIPFTTMIGALPVHRRHCRCRRLLDSRSNIYIYIYIHDDCSNHNENVSSFRPDRIYTLN